MISPERLREVFHDLKNILANVQGYTELLLQECREGEASEHANLVLYQAAELGRVIGALSDLTREAQSYRHPPTPLERVFQSWRRHPLANRLMIDFQAEPDAYLPLSADKIKALFNQLASNTIRFCRPPCRATLQAGPGRLDWSDNGPGPDPQHLPLLGSPFVCFPPRTGAHYGPGLGLAHCRRLVEEAGGKIQFSLSPSGSFWVRIHFKGP